MMAFLVNAPWRGNVRELANFIERAAILTTGEELELPREELRSCQERHIVGEANSTFRQAESTAIIDALKAAAGRIAGRGGAAERLGLKRTTLQNKMRQLNICRTDYSSAKEMSAEVSAAAYESGITN